MTNPHVRARRVAPDPRASALRAWVDPLTARVREPEIAWLAARPDFDPDNAAHAARSLVDAARACLATRQRMQDRADTLRAHLVASDGAARREALARHLRVTVSDPRRLRADVRALDRDLDLDALLEREAGEIEIQGARAEVAARALGGLLPTLPDEDAERAGGHALLADVAEWDPRAPTRRVATASLAGALVGPLARGYAVEPRVVRVLQRLVRAHDEDPWVRRAALQVTVGLPAPLARRWLAEAADATEGREPFLLRARAVELLLQRAEPWAHAEAAARRADPSELVRATLVDGLRARLAAVDLAAEALLAELLRDDPEPRVRARAAEAVTAAGSRGLALLAPALRDVPLVASFALDAALALVRSANPLPQGLRDALVELRRDGPPGLARQAARVLLCARAAASPAWPTALFCATLPPGTRRVVSLPRGADIDGLAEALAVLAADDYGFTLAPRGSRVLVTRDDVYRPTLWRFLHEVRSPAPAKRQGHSHTLGRADMGPVRVPPGALAEESATGVPGERVRVEREDGWAPAVPLVDDYLHATLRDEVRIVTPEGVTRILAPDGLFRRLRARARLVWRYARYDGLRTASLEERDPALRARYVASFEELGFVTEHDGEGPSRHAFANGTMGPLGWLLGAGGSSLPHLAVVVALLAVFLFGRAAWALRTVRRARKAIPLVIGGWGTRGKSGTERLKAGMLEGLGVPLLSKTTGCEAMVLHAPPGGHAVELFLFRPYDKATIWEQVDVVRLAGDVGARAMLWECMGLNPIYVDLLQAGWMRDDLSTLTNAYPDHEDIQGPSGMDVARVIGGFAPPDALVLTTEENLRPVLAEEARRRNATLQPVRRVDRELVPRDLLDRMPHAEHPANVALAAAAATALGVEWVEAVGLMAEHVVPDLGALVIYPRARHMSRDVVFANGMSANDTLSFRHNWRRTGFATHDHVAEPARWLVTVVNNRADRVARSRVFAQILANDANAHRHVLIGTNLRGLAGYLDGAVEERLAGHVLDGDPARVDQLFAHLRLVDPAALGRACGERLYAAEDALAAWEAACAVPSATTLAEARERAEAGRAAAVALEGACLEGRGLADHLLDALARWALWHGVRRAAHDVTRAAYRELVRASVVLVEDSGASGDRVMATAIGAVPPGAEARIMGIQNIKGTGLDFAYQWVWWRELHGHLQRLAAADPERRRLALDGVEQNPLGSALACDAAAAALEPLRADPQHGPRVVALLARVEARRAALLAARAGAAAPAKQGALVRLFERLVDPFDAILRRRRALQVFDDLAHARISHPRAQAELKRLTERQKGGWLGKG